MSTIFVIAGLLVTAAPQASTDQVDAAFADLQANRNGAAIERIEPAVGQADAHPAQLINLGVAYARNGDTERARAMFRQAANADTGYSLETASGAWVDSRTLALRGLAMIDRGALGGVTRTAAR